ncbi:MAG: hypothetical protein HC918_02305 [Oscillatoriales cyanobacterium SM2_1_8]|nr:hypothetical protein [Oscillatoriales cyanobacterium SM2_1_8]
MPRDRPGVALTVVALWYVFWGWSLASAHLPWLVWVGASVLTGAIAVAVAVSWFWGLPLVLGAAGWLAADVVLQALWLRGGDALQTFLADYFFLGMPVPSRALLHGCLRLVLALLWLSPLFFARQALRETAPRRRAASLAIASAIGLGLGVFIAILW